jgi:hypothetical protein
MTTFTRDLSKDPLMTYEKALITQSRPGEIPSID